VELRVLRVANGVLPAVFVKPVLYVYPRASSSLVLLSGNTSSHLRINFCLDIKGQPLGGKKFDLVRVTLAEDKYKSPSEAYRGS